MAALHTDRAFEKDLRDLRELLLAMGARVESLIADSVRALTERDAALAEQVAKGDAQVNRMELEIDDLCRRILALRQPAASDLRLITTALKIVTDLERIGDLAVSVALRAKELSMAPALPTSLELPKLADAAQRQVRLSLDAFVHSDVTKAEAVINGDDLVDAVYGKLFNDLLGLMMEDSRNIRRATALMFIAKHLERMGDHAMNVAEMVIYLAKGTDIRHPRSRVPKR